MNVHLLTLVLEYRHDFSHFDFNDVKHDNQVKHERPQDFSSFICINSHMSLVSWKHCGAILQAAGRHVIMADWYPLPID